MSSRHGPPSVAAALRVAGNKRVDPMTFNTPQALVNQFRDVSVREGASLADPDAVPEFKDKEDRGDGVVVYSVDDTQAGQKAVRDVLNNNYGKDFDCWCLVYGNEHGGLSTQAWDYWEKYNKIPKKIAFQDGRAVAFQADDTGEGLWWDLADESHYWLEDITDGRMWDEHGKMRENYTGVMRVRDQNGQLAEEVYYKDGEQDGTERVWHENGQLSVESYYENGKRDGLHREWHPNGKPKVESHFKDGKADGVQREWHENGQIAFERYYKDDKRDGVWRQWYPNGQLNVELHYKDGKQVGVEQEWYGNGQIHNEKHWKDGKWDGVQRNWRSDGSVWYESHWKDGKLDGVWREWGPDGKLRAEEHYRDGELVEDSEGAGPDADDGIRFRTRPGGPAGTADGFTPEQAAEAAEAIRAARATGEARWWDGLSFIRDAQAKLEAAGEPTSAIDTPERNALREEIARTVYAKASENTGKGRELHIVMGLPASGKSRIVVRRIQETVKAVVIDADDIKPLLPEYDGGAGAGRVHNESSIIAEKLIMDNLARKAGDNVIFPTIGRNLGKPEKIVRRFKDSGYKVFLYNVRVNPDTSIERALNRYVETGRFVSPEYILVNCK